MLPEPTVPVYDRYGGPDVGQAAGISATDEATASTLVAGARVGRWMRARRRPARNGRLFEGGVLIGLGVAALAVPDRRAA